MTEAADIPIQVQVGLAIKAERLRRGWTQGDLAEPVGISEQGLSKIERGASVPTLNTLEAIAKALGVAVRDLFPAGSDAEVKDEAARRIMAKLAALSADELRRVEGVIAAMTR